MTPRSLTLTALALAIAAGLWISSEDSDRPTPRRTDGNPPADEAPANPPTTGSQRSPATTAAPATGAMLKLPDGTEAAPLNGVQQPAAMTWGNRPYAPIVTTTWSDGVEWYVHENGTRSTTVDLFRQDLGRHDAVTVVAHPGEPSPIDALGEIGEIRHKR